MTYEFDRDTAVAATGPDRYRAQLQAGWSVGAAINGGYLMAIIGNAVRNRVGGDYPDPFSVSAHFLSAATAGPATVETEVIRRGGRFVTTAARLIQDVDGVPTPRIAALATYGDLDHAHDPESDTAAAAVGLVLPPPELVPPDQCVAPADAPAEVLQIAPILERFATRLEPASAMWTVGEPSRRGVIQGWFMLADERPLDPVALLMVVDALPPVTFDLGMPGWAPTLELTAHIRAKPAPGWVLLRHYTRTMAGGMFEEDCEVWDSTGTLVAQSRQLALQPRI